MKITGDVLIFEERLPPPSTIELRCITFESTQSGKVFGSVSGVTPPIFIAVSLVVSSILANETFRAPNFFLIVLFISSLVVANKAHAAYFNSPVFPVLMVF